MKSLAEEGLVKSRAEEGFVKSLAEEECGGTGVIITCIIVYLTFVQIYRYLDQKPYINSSICVLCRLIKMLVPCTRTIPI